MRAKIAGLYLEKELEARHACTEVDEELVLARLDIRAGRDPIGSSMQAERTSGGTQAAAVVTSGGSNPPRKARRRQSDGC